MTMLHRAQTLQDELSRLRRDIHEHPELGFQEFRTAALVADTLREFLEHGNVRNAVNFPESVLPRTQNSVRLAIANENVPNMVGQISSALASASLNIADLLNKSRGDLAYSLIDVDGANIPDSVVQQLRAIPGVLSVRVL